MSSSSLVLALDVPPNQLVTLPCAKCASTARGWAAPRSLNECAHRFGAPLVACRPWAVRCPRVHQRAVGTRQEAIVDEEILFQRQARIASLQIAGPIGGDPVAQDQILGARRRPDRVRLHEPQLADGPQE